MTEEILARARAGDEDAFRELTDPYRREFQLHCYRILGSLQDAEDLVQETLLAAWRGLEGFEGRASVRAWLYRIATNRCVNALRDRERRQALRDRHQIEHDLQEALAELDHIREAVRRGLLSDLTKQMLEEAEERVRNLRAQLEAPGRADLHALRVLPQVVQQRLEELEQVLRRDVNRAREALRDIMGRSCFAPRLRASWPSSEEISGACSLSANRPLCW